MRKPICKLGPAFIAAACSTAALAQTAPVVSTWNTSEGRMTLNQNSQAIYGTYTTDNGRIMGTLSGRTLNGFWVESMADRRCITPKNGSYYWGGIRFEFDQRMSRFAGRWSYCDRPVSPGDGDWTGQILSYSINAGGGQTVTWQGGAGGAGSAGGAGGGGGALASPCFTNSYAVANVGPCYGKVSSSLSVRQLRPASAPLGRLIFKAVLANGVPAQVIVPLTGGGPTFAAAVVPQLCAQGGPAWDVWLQTTTNQNQGVIGRFQPDCR